MAPLTVSLATFPVAVDRAGYAAPDVLGVRHWFQMIRVHAGGVSTQVVDREPRRNRPDEIRPDDAVSHALSRGFTLGSPIPQSVLEPEPFPTVSRSVDPVSQRRVTASSTRGEKVKH